ncbi:MAG: nucleotide exchange factor GrpE [Calditrichaeota bacterium]|nr:MAG: nucleotide exchange factor GrpE [Calditrichota bacterium]
MTEIKIEEKKNSGGKKNDGSKSKSRESKQTRELRKKIEQLEQENKKLQDDAGALRDQLLRKAAEFDNYKRRTEREFLDNIQNASQELIVELLPVIDDLERSIAHARANEQDAPMLQGVELIYKNLMTLLEKRGLKPIEAIGHEFDPDKHNALMQVDSDQYDSGVVVDQHVKGYTLNDKVIRHAQVMVAK